MSFSIPAEFALLSNEEVATKALETVSIPSEFTLLSNFSVIYDS